MGEDDDLDLGRAVVRGVRRGIRNDAAAFAYSILATAAFGAVQLEHGPTTVPRLFAFALGATLGFALCEAAASRGFRIRLRQERSDVVLLGSALAPLSVSLGLGVGLLVSRVVGGTWAWALVPLAATIVYVAATGAQLALAHHYERRHPPTSQD